MIFVIKFLYTAPFQRELKSESNYSATVLHSEVLMRYKTCLHS